MNANVSVFQDIKTFLHSFNIYYVTGYLCVAKQYVFLIEIDNMKP